MSTPFQQFRLNSSFTVSFVCYPFHYSLEHIYVLIARDFYSNRGPVVALTLAITLIVERLAVELLLSVFTTWVCRGWNLNTQPFACEAKALTHCATFRGSKPFGIKVNKVNINLVVRKKINQSIVVLQRNTSFVWFRKKLRC